MDMAMQRTLYERNRIPPHCMTNYIKAKIEKKQKLINTTFTEVLK